MHYGGTLLLLLHAEAVSGMSTTSREDSSSTTAVSRWFLMLSSFAYTAHSLVYQGNLFIDSKLPLSLGVEAETPTRQVPGMIRPRVRTTDN